jgi:caffeoyl-CoA O-methyltransferase
MKNFIITYATLFITLLFSVSVAIFSPGGEIAGLEGSGHSTEIFSDTLPAVDEILEKYIQALGDRQAIEKLETRVCRGRFIHDLNWKTPSHEEVSFEAYFHVPDKWMYSETSTEGILREGCDGKTLWTQKNNDIELLTDRKWTKLSFLLDPQGSLHIQNYFHGLVVKGKESVSGRTVYVVQPESLSAAHYSLYFDAETGLLNRIGYYDELSDYRDVDGVQVPFRMAKSRKGGSSTYVFDEVIHNVPIDGSLFSPPDSYEIPDDPFQDINDPKVRPMLEHLAHTHGGLNIPARDGRFLYNLIIKNNYKRGLEIGTSNGYSTLWLGLAFRKTGGTAITIEYEEKRAEEARENFRRAGLDQVIDLRINDAFEEIPKIDGDFDFIFIDAWKSDYIRFWEMLRDRITTGGTITAHNVISQGNHMQGFLKAIQNDLDYETTIHEIGPAGISVSRRIQ